jgi:5-methylcytosine-specific restriction protein B
MTNYFTNKHFKLLNSLKGQKRDDSNVKQNLAYAELKKAYEFTEAWAKEVGIRLFPTGFVDVRKRPTNQANSFVPYNWARIYPATNSPKELAYTVGIDATDGFVVKIDTVGLNESNSVRREYLQLRGSKDNTSPVVAVLSASDGLKMSMNELVDWSLAAINKFRFSYYDVVAKLKLVQSDENVQRTHATTTQAINRIYYGPPGTGKTYMLSKLLKDYKQDMSSASDEERREQLIADQIVNWKWWEAAAAALHELGGEANVDKLMEHPFLQAKAAHSRQDQDVRGTLLGTLQDHTISESKTVNKKRRLPPAIFDKTVDKVWRLAGDWEESCAHLIEFVTDYQSGAPTTGTVDRYRFVTFHQSYGYEEFVEGLRPILGGEENAGEVQYEIRPGVFKKLCERARSAPQHRFAMVIDEINRGNISKIFGELITLIELDKREGAEHAVSVTLPYSGDPFSVPPNVDIIGTMNTADRSLALLDTALRRRFDFLPLLPDARDEENAPLSNLRVNVDQKVIDIPRMLSVINQRIEALYDRDHCIGHAYFIKLKKMDDGRKRMAMLSEIFRHRIVPLLEEYFFEDWQKIRLVLADNQKSEPFRFVTESGHYEQDLERLFGSDHGLGNYAAKQRYEVQNRSFDNPDAYIGIYQTLPA